LTKQLWHHLEEFNRRKSTSPASKVRPPRPRHGFSRKPHVHPARQRRSPSTHASLPRRLPILMYQSPSAPYLCCPQSNYQTNPVPFPNTPKPPGESARPPRNPCSPNQIALIASPRGPSGAASREPISSAIRPPAALPFGAAQKVPQADTPTFAAIRFTPTAS
jgi:hypothetical protein